MSPRLRQRVSGSIRLTSSATPIKSADTVGKQILVTVEEDGIVEEFVDRNEGSRVRHCRAIAGNAGKISERIM